MRNLILVLTVAILAGCEYNNATYKEKEPVNDNYLPLNVGNYWNFKSIGLSQGPGGSEIQFHREVASIVTINHHEYYLLIDTSPINNNTYKDSSYYRIDTNGFVYIYRKARPDFEDNLFRLNGNDHDTWSFPVEGGDHAQITLGVGSVTLGHVTLTNCKGYQYDVPNWADEEYSVTLAPGIGFVREYGAWGFGQILTSAKIDGQVFNF